MLRAFGVLVAALIGLTVSTGAHAQSQPIYQSGLMTPRHVLAWATNGVAEDPEQVSIGGLSQLTLTNTGTPFCINDALTTAQGGYHQFCIGANSLGGGLISYQAYGGATPLGLQCNINGSILPCFPSGGNVTGPTSPAPNAGDAVVWNGGVTVKDGGAPPAYQVDTVAALKALSVTPLTNGQVVQLNGYLTKGDSPRVSYQFATSACSLNAGAGDGGSQIPSSTVGNCYNLAPQVAYDPRTWGAVGSTFTTTATISAASHTATLASAGDLVNGQPIGLFGAGAAYTLGTPTAPTVTFSGTAGSTTWYCKVEAVDAGFGISIASPEGSVGSAAATLDASDSITVSWSSVSSAVAYVVLCGTTTGVETYVIGTTKITYTHFGGTATRPSWVPNTPLVAAQNGLLQTTIASGAGTTTVSLTDPAISAVTSGVFVHDSTAAFQAAAATGLPLNGVPCLNFNVLAPVTFATQGQGLAGVGWQCSQVSLYTPASDMMLATGRAVQFTNIEFDGTNMLDGFANFASSGGDKFIVDRVYYNQAPGLIKMTGINTSYISNIYGAIARGGTTDANNRRSLISAYSSGESSEVAALTITNAILGCPHINAMGFHANGAVDTTTLTTIESTFCGAVIYYENTVSANASRPTFLTPGSNAQAQSPIGDGFDFVSGQDIHLDHPFANAVGGNFLVTGSATLDVQIKSPQFAGAQQAGVVFGGKQNLIDGGYIKNAGKGGVHCAAYANSYCPGVGLLTTANGSIISHATITSGVPGQQQYGVDAVSGAMNTILDSNNLTGNSIGDWINEVGANPCGNSSGTSIVVTDEGQCPDQSNIDNVAGTTILAAAMTRPYPMATANAWRSGTTTGAFNDPLDGAGNIQGLISSVYVGYTWIVRIENNTAAGNVETITSSGDATTTAAGIRTISYNNWRNFLCIVTAIGGSPTVTCTGQ